MDVLKNRLLGLVGILLVIAVVGFYRHFGIQDKSTLTICTIYILTAVYMLWPWRSAKTEFIKRCILAAPFALLLTIVVRVFGFEIAFSIYVGIVLFLFLALKTDNWRQHFFITLMSAFVFTFLLAYLWHGDLNVYKVYIIPGLALPFMVFYVAYLGTIDSKEPAKFRRLLAKTIKFATTVTLTFYLLLLSNHLCRHYHISFVISFGFSVLIALAFLAVCYRFKIGLSDSSVSNNSNEITNKKFIDRLKMRFYGFRGKDEKTDNAGKCEFCGRSIWRSEVSHAIKGHIVCGQCYKKIEEEKARIT